jgi:hypothetical protein
MTLRRLSTRSHEPPASARAAARITGGADPRARRGLILIVVLVMVVLLSLLAASYSYMVNANMRGVISRHQEFQARMAAESGFQYAISILREARYDPGVWYNNPALFRAVLVEGTDEETDTRQFNETGQYDAHAQPAWRFHLVARNEEDPATVRYGITDETSKLDLNLATQDQLRRLMTALIPQEADNAVDVAVLVDSLLDWRERGTAPRPNGAKDEYYATLEPPYRCKQAPFSTIEELLLVRGFTSWVLFGEDYNRNGLLDAGEDDDLESFPPDNADGLLYAGIAPYLTLWSQEINAASDAQPRINLNMEDTAELQEQLQQFLPGQLVSYVMDIRGSGIAFNSVMNLLPAPPPLELEGFEEAEPEDPTSQPVQNGPSTSQPTSASDDGFAATTQDASSDLDGTDGASENDAQTRRLAYRDLSDPPPPGTYEDLPVILDRLTVLQSPVFSGRVNFTTAPRAVLSTFELLTPEEVEALVAARLELSPEERATPAWILQRGVLDENKFRAMLNRMAMNASTFEAESIGYADHIGAWDRFRVVFEMRGPIAQVRYHRRLNALGTAYTPHGDERRDFVKRGG